MIRFFIFLLFAVKLFCGEAISALYLSWYEDPTTTMTIQWHCHINQNESSLFLSLPDQKKAKFTSSHHLFADKPIQIHTVTLKNLTPNTTYSFQIGEKGTSYTFQTAPNDLTKPLRFCIGGDLYLSPKLFRKMAQNVCNENPLFVVIGGDIAYAINKHPRPVYTSEADQWLTFLADWKNYLIASDNRVIPFLLVPGNHDITPSNYEQFFSLFAFPEKRLYRAIDFGSYLTLLLLDTDHFQPIQGKQTQWLKETLQSHSKIPYIFPIYHVGAYPSVYPFQGLIPKKIRTHWCPLFDQFNIKATFEHHNHAYKKTYPLKGGELNPQGTIYFGDGCWGVPPRAPEKRWYLDKIGRKNQIYSLEISHNSSTIKALDLSNETLDQTQIPPRP